MTLLSASKSLALALVLSLGAGATSCGGTVADARPQWVVDVYTDAPVPQLGDRVLVEVLAPDGSPGCAGCRRIFGVFGADAWPLSFGIPEAEGKSLRLRVRLFRSDHSDAGGSPSGGLPIDSLEELPQTGGGVRRVALTLFTECAGVAADVTRGLTCDPATGGLVARALADRPRDGGPKPGSFALAQPVPCARPAREGMVCVEGGLFVRGDTRIELEGETIARHTPERLVRLSPFALDRQEMSVRDMRALVDKGLVERPAHRSPDAVACYYTDVPDAYEDFPVNCISRDLSARACKARGLRLPTEAEWEFAAGNRDQETHYPWGADPNICRFGVVGRGRTLAEGKIDDSSVCRHRPDAAPLPWGPRPVGEADDVTMLGIHDLAGNLSEWTADSAEAYDGPCSEGPRILVNPRCDHANDTTFVVRGGSWALPPNLAEATSRSAYPDALARIETGFRCAESL